MAQTGIGKCMTKRVLLIGKSRAFQGRAQKHITTWQSPTAKAEHVAWGKNVMLPIACNGRQEGRMFQVAPHAKQDDGRIDFVGVRTISRPKMLFTLPYMICGDHKRLSYCFHGSFETLEMTSKQPLIMHADGEIISGFDSQIHSVRIKAVPGALEIVVPASPGQIKVREYA
jgi:diacylglycerol kinase family enzyme